MTLWSQWQKLSLPVILHDYSLDKRWADEGEALYLCSYVIFLTKCMTWAWSQQLCGSKTHLCQTNCTFKPHFVLSLNDSDVSFWDINIQVHIIYIASDCYEKTYMHVLIISYINYWLWQIIYFLFIIKWAASSKCLRIYCQYYILLAFYFQGKAYNLHLFYVTNK